MVRFGRVPESAWVWIAVSGGAILFLLLGPFSNYGAAGFLDPWFYIGYFTNFSYLLRHVGDTYYVSRLPWILPGLLAFRLAPPEAASVALHTVIVTVSAGSLYWAVRWHYGRWCGILAAAVLAASPQFMATVGWAYPDGPAIAYGFAALAFAMRPHGSRAHNTILMAVFLALSGLTNMAAAPMILSIAAVPLYRQRRDRRELLREALRIGAGAGATVLIFCPVSQILFGRWTYFYWQVHQAIHIAGSLASMYGTGPGFLPSAPRLFAPVLLLLLGPLLWRAKRLRPAAREAWLSLLFCAVLYAFQEFVLKGAALRVHYQSSYMIVPMFFCGGAFLGELCNGSTRLALAAAAFACGLPICWRAANPSVTRGQAWMALAVMLAAAVILTVFRETAGSLAGGTAISGRALIYGARRSALPFLLVAALFCAPAFEVSIGYAWDRPSARYGRNVDVFRSLMALQAYLKSAVDPRRRVQFWFDAGEPYHDLYNSAESLYLWMHHDFTHDLSRASADAVRAELAPNATLVHLTLYPERLEERRALLASRGIATSNRREWSGPAGLHVVLEDVAGLEGLH
jgi:hypothetical protein